MYIVVTTSFAVMTYMLCVYDVEYGNQWHGPKSGRDISGVTDQEARRRNYGAAVESVAAVLEDAQNASSRERAAQLCVEQPTA